MARRDANFDAFDDILDKFRVDVSDRFADLPPNEQETLVAEATAAVEENLTDYDARMRRVESFKQGVDHFKEQIRESYASA